MAWLGGVFADASVGTVGTTVSGWGAVDLGVANDQFVRVVGHSFETALVNALTGNGGWRVLFGMRVVANPTRVPDKKVT